jgi:hypothetical protein
MKKNRFYPCVLLGITLLLCGCGGGGGGGDGGTAATTPAATTPAATTATTGTLSVGLTDATTTDYQAIYVTVQEVAVHRDNGGDWDVVSSPNKTYNLLDLVNGVREELGLATLATGHYTQMRLILKDQPDDSLNILSRKHPYGNYFIDSTGQSTELKVPSGFQTGIKIVQGFDIDADQTTELVLDFDAARSVVKAGKSGKWLLKPTIKMLNTAGYSIIEGRVTDSINGAAVEGVLVSAQVYDASAVAPEDRVQVQAATVTDANGNYRLFLEPGTYTVVGYKDGYATFHTDTQKTFTARNVFTGNFTLTLTANTGTVSGTVNIPGADQEQHATISIRQDATLNTAPLTTIQVEIKSLNVANGGPFAAILSAPPPPGSVSYTAVISTYGKDTIVQPFALSANANTNLGAINFP